MNPTVAIVLAVGLVGAAVLVLRRQAAAEGTDLCSKLGAVDGKAGAACSILGALGLDSETPRKVVGGITSAPTHLSSSISSAIGFGGNSGPFICGVYAASGKPRSQWPADVRSKCP